MNGSASNNQPYHTQWSLSIGRNLYYPFFAPDMKSTDSVTCRIKKKPHCKVKEKGKGSNWEQNMHFDTCPLKWPFSKNGSSPVHTGTACTTWDTGITSGIAISDMRFQNGEKLVLCSEKKMKSNLPLIYMIVHSWRIQCILQPSQNTTHVVFSQVAWASAYFYFFPPSEKLLRQISRSSVLVIPHRLIASLFSE